MSRWAPHVTVATIVEHKGKLLFVEEFDKATGNRVYNQPAGHLEDKESLIAAAKRETLEETGCDVEITGYMGLYTYTAPSNGVTYHRHCFVGKLIVQNTNASLDDGIIAAQWLSLEEVIDSGMARSPLVIKCAEDYQEKSALPLSVIYEH